MADTNGFHSNGNAVIDAADPRMQPASFLTSQLNGSTDPADSIPGMAANFGRDVVPHVLTFQSIIGSHAKVYRDCDEATKASLDNARFMRNDCGIMECVEARQRCVSLLDFSLEPEDENSHEQKELCAVLTTMLERIVNFTEYRYTLMHAIWYGKYAINNRYGWQMINGKMRQLPTPLHEDDYGWRPISGDKLVFRYDDGNLPDGAYPNQLGIRVHGSYQVGNTLGGRYKIARVDATDRGMAYFIPPWERKLITVHRHIIEDAAYEDAISAGAIHGLGIRSRIYWEWFQKQETLGFLMEYLERSAGGIEVWTYPMGNPQAKSATEEAARQRLGGARNVVVVPKPLGAEGEQYGVEIVEPGMAGIDTLKDILNTYHGHRIKRYILGQTLTSEAESTGLGSGVADAHMDTFMQIVRFDAMKLQETMTRQLVKPLKDFNFPHARGIHIRLKLKVEHEDVKEKLEAYEAAYNMGAALKESEVMETIGASIPGPNDKVLQMQQKSGGIPGMAGVPGQPGKTGGIAPAASMTAQQFERAFDGKHPGGPDAPGGPNGGQQPGGNGGGDSPMVGGPVNPGDGGDRSKVDQYANANWQQQHRDKNGRWTDPEAMESADNDESPETENESLRNIGQQIADALEAISRGGDDASENRSLLRQLIGRARKLADLDDESSDVDVIEHYARRGKLKPSSHQKQLLGDDQQEFRWITIGGHAEDGGGEHHGGTHVKIDRKGNIVAGPKELADKGIKNLHDFGSAEHPEERKKPKPSRKVGGEHQPGLFEPDEELGGQKLLGLVDSDSSEATSQNSGEPPREFLTAGQAAMQGLSHAAWTAPISDAYTGEQIDDDHPAWQSIQSGTAPTVDQYNDARSLYGEHVRLMHNGKFGKVTGIADDAKTVEVTLADGSVQSVDPQRLDHAGASVASRATSRGALSLKSHADYLGPALAQEAVERGENISETMRRHGMDPVKHREIRAAVADAVVNIKAKQENEEKPAPSDARQRAMNKQAAAEKSHWDTIKEVRTQRFGTIPIEEAKEHLRNGESLGLGGNRVVTGIYPDGRETSLKADLDGFSNMAGSLVIGLPDTPASTPTTDRPSNLPTEDSQPIGEIRGGNGRFDGAKTIGDLKGLLRDNEQLHVKKYGGGTQAEIHAVRNGKLVFLASAAIDDTPTDATPEEQPAGDAAALPDHVDPGELSRMDRKIDRLRNTMDSRRKIFQQPQQTPGPFVTGRSGYTQGKKLDAENDRKATAFREHEEAKREYERLQSIRDGYIKGTNHPNGQPRVPGAVEARQAAKDRNQEKIAKQGFDTRKIYRDVNMDGKSTLPDGTVVSMHMDFLSDDGGYQFVVTRPDGTEERTPFAGSIARLQSGGELRKILSKSKSTAAETVPQQAEPDDTQVAAGEAPDNSGWSPETHVTIAADSIDKLRGQDVYRLLDSAPPERMESMANWIVKNRPDLSGDVHDARIDIHEERGGKPEMTTSATEAATEAAVTPEQPTGPKDGDRNAEGLVFRDGRWHREGEQQSAQDEPVAKEQPSADPPQPPSQPPGDGEQPEDEPPKSQIHGRTVRGDGKPKGFSRHLGNGKRDRIMQSAMMPKVGEVFEIKDGPYVITKVGRLNLLTRDHLDDMDDFDIESGWHQEFEAVPVERTADEQDAVNKKSFEQAQKEQQNRDSEQAAKSAKEKFEESKPEYELELHPPSGEKIDWKPIDNLPGHFEAEYKGYRITKRESHSYDDHRVSYGLPKEIAHEWSMASFLRGGWDESDADAFLAKYPNGVAGSREYQVLKELGDEQKAQLKKRADQRREVETLRDTLNSLHREMNTHPSGSEARKSHENSISDLTEKIHAINRDVGDSYFSHSPGRSPREQKRLNELRDFVQAVEPGAKGLQSHYLDDLSRLIPDGDAGKTAWINYVRFGHEADREKAIESGAKAAKAKMDELREYDRQDREEKQRKNAEKAAQRAQKAKQSQAAPEAAKSSGESFAEKKRASGDEIRAGGKTFDNKDALRQMGARWNPRSKEWVFDVSNHSDSQLANLERQMDRLKSRGVRFYSRGRNVVAVENPLVIDFENAFTNSAKG